MPPTPEPAPAPDAANEPAPTPAPAPDREPASEPTPDDAQASATGRAHDPARAASGAKGAGAIPQRALSGSLAVTMGAWLAFLAAGVMVVRSALALLQVDESCAPGTLVVPGPCGTAAWLTLGVAALVIAAAVAASLRWAGERGPSMRALGVPVLSGGVGVALLWAGTTSGYESTTALAVGAVHALIAVVAVGRLWSSGKMRDAFATARSEEDEPLHWIDGGVYLVVLGYASWLVSGGVLSVSGA